MYKCTVRIYFAACPSHVLEIARGISPLANFRHEFMASPGLNLEMLSRADAIFAGPGLAHENLLAVASKKLKDAALVLLRERGDKMAAAVMDAAADVWRLPMDEEDLRFHFSRWQKSLRQRKDLAEKEQFLECLLETSPNLVWYKDKDGVHELVNRAFCETVGKTRQQVQGRRHAYIWNVDADDPACVESERIVMESGLTHISEEEIDTGGGKRLLKTYKSPLRDDNGEMMGTLGIGVDVTRERQYLESLIQNNAALETLFTSMDCGILTHTLDGRQVIGVNNAALKLLGFSSREELAAEFMTVAATVVEEDKIRLREAIGRLENEGDSASYEYRIMHDNGEMLHVMGNAKLVKKDGELICQRFLLDCTAQKLAQEKAEAENKRRQEELVRALCMDFQLVCVFDGATHEGTVLQLMDMPDPCLKEIFSGEAPLSEKFSLYIRNCAHPEDRQACQRAFNLDILGGTLEGENPWYFKYRALKGDEPHYFQLKAVRGASVNGSFSIVMGLQSIDARARYEMEQKSRLESALDQARRASQSKSVFLSNMSHDIRTPMNAIAGYTALALKQLEKPDYVAGYLHKIGASCDHLISLINDILDMSHIESGKIQLEEKLWNLPGLLRELENIVRPTADAKMQTLELHLDIANADIYCDKLRLNQVLLNFLSNAVKYTPEGGHINMGVAQLARSGPDRAVYEFRVKDNGMGMSEDFVKRIFDPFERAQSSTIAGIQGTGLGMTIARNIVDMMNGDIEVRSKLGLGSEFVFRVPFRIGRENDAPLETPEHAADAEYGRGLPPGLDSCRVLLAEDNAMNQEIAREFLEGAGYCVDVANNGREAIDMLNGAGAGYYNVVLMDVQMPVMGGYEATEKIRALPDKRLATVPILAMTANSFEEDRQEALNRGMNGHIAKPIDFGILFGTLARLLGVEQAAKNRGKV